MKKYAIAILLITGLASPAFAADFFVAQNATTHKCAVTPTKPNGKSMIQVSNESYKNRGDAKKAMKDLSECKA